MVSVVELLPGTDVLAEVEGRAEQAREESALPLDRDCRKSFNGRQAAHKILKTLNILPSVGRFGEQVGSGVENTSSEPNSRVEHKLY